MKTREQIIREIDARIATEKAILAESGANNYVGAAAMAVIDELTLLKDWILDK